MKEIFKGIIVFILALAIIVSLWFGYLMLLRPSLDLKREAVQSSQQYVESKQSMLMMLVDDYYTAETDEHQKAVYERIVLESQRIDYDLLPESIKHILKENN